MKRIHCVGAIALLVVLGGCNRGIPNDPSLPLGVTLGAGSKPEVVYRSCSLERVASVEIKQFVEGNPEAQTRWRIEATTEPVAFEPIRIGVTPPGFEEVVPLATQPAGSTHFITILETEVDGKNVRTTANFIPEDLEEGRVMTSVFDSISASEFEEQLSCPGEN